MKKICHEPKNFNGIMIVGEAPGRQENYIGKPFVGPEGQYLRSKCKLAGFDLNDCYITNTVHKKPYNNIYETLDTTTIQLGKSELKRDIEKWKPNVIVALGSHSLEMICDKTGIHKYRGAVMHSTLVPGYKVLPSIHPGNIFKGNSKYDVVLRSDLDKAFNERKSSEIYYPERNIEVIHTVGEGKALLRSLTNVKTPHAVDIETAGGKLVAYGIAISRKQAYVIPKELCSNIEVLRKIGEYAYSQTPKMFHNAAFDVFHNAYYYKILNNNVYYDTMLAGHACFPTLPKSLAFYASFFTNEVYWKDEGKEIIKDIQKNKIVDWPSFYIYNGKDCCLTYEIYENLEEEIDYWEVRPIFDMMMALLGPALLSQMTGLVQDKNKVEKFKENNEKEIEILEQIKEAVLGDINVGSHKQVKELIYGQWDLPKQYSWNKGKKTLTTSHDKLAVIERYPTPYKPHIGLIKRIKKATKLRDFYNVITNEDGRVRFSQKITGTYTGRWSTSKSITGSGFNIQNQPHKIRTFYRADKGKILLEPDLSNAEARIVAALTGDEEWLASFDKEDQHSRVAMELFNIPLEKVRDLKPGSGKKYRDASKQISHATHYLHGWMSLSEKLACSAAEAKRHKANYYELRPNLAMWQRWVGQNGKDAYNAEAVKSVRETRLIRTCFGRVIQFFGPNFDSMLTDAIAAEPQSTSVDYLNFALVRYYNEIPEFEFKQQGHDSVLCQVDDDLQCVENVILKMKKITEIPITVMGVREKNGFIYKDKPMELIIPLDFKIGYWWGEMEEVKDLNALKTTYEKLQS